MDLTSINKAIAASEYFQKSDDNNLLENNDTPIVPVGGKVVKNLDKGLKIEHNLRNLANATPNGVINNFSQGRSGDCYLLASLSALSSTKQGAEILKKNLTKNPDGSYTITLPGAQIAAGEAAADRRKSYITGTYTFTKADIAKARRSGKYSNGDVDVLLYELAFERYRKEVMKTNNANGTQGAWRIGEEQGGATADSPLKGGQPADAMFVLTGKKASLYAGNADKVDAVPAEQIKAISPQIHDSNIREKEINKYLDRIMREPGRYAVTISFKLSGNRGQHGYHALQLKSVTKDSVILINPWNSNKEITMSREQFLKSQYSMTVWDSKDKGIMQNVVDTVSDFWHTLAGWVQS